MAHYGSGGAIRLPSAPRNVEQITSDAQSYEYNALVGMRYWLRTARTLVREAGKHQFVLEYEANICSCLRQTSTKEKVMMNKHTFFSSDMPI
jgi:hypothetical protein